MTVYFGGDGMVTRLRCDAVDDEEALKVVTVMEAAEVAKVVEVHRRRVLLVDDQPLFRAGVAQLLESQPDLVVAAEVGSAEEAIAVVHRDPVDIVLLGVVMQATSGVALAGHLLEIQPACKLLAISSVDEPVMIAAMLRSGAAGYAVKTQPPTEIMEAIRAVLDGERYLPPTVPRGEVLARVEGGEDAPLQRLTRREREIFDLLIRGNSNDQIGTRLFITRRTVETHRQRIMKKLATHSMLEMIRVAAREGAF
jgi:DNA-binding NarL/FixJ family response regulator